MRPSLCLSVTGTLSRKLCERAAGVIKATVTKGSRNACCRCVDPELSPLRLHYFGPQSMLHAVSHILVERYSIKAAHACNEANIGWR